MTKRKVIYKSKPNTEKYAYHMNYPTLKQAQQFVNDIMESDYYNKWKPIIYKNPRKTHNAWPYHVYVLRK